MRNQGWALRGHSFGRRRLLPTVRSNSIYAREMGKRTGLHATSNSSNTFLLTATVMAALSALPIAIASKESPGQVDLWSNGWAILAIILWGFSFLASLIGLGVKFNAWRTSRVPLVIIEALYGVGTAWKDVTAIAQGYVHGDRFDVLAGNEPFDVLDVVAPNLGKYLKVLYSLRGSEAIRVEWQEGQRAQIPSAP